MQRDSRGNPWFPFHETYGTNLAQLMSQPNWYNNANVETRQGCGPCQVGSVRILRPPHFWGAQPNLAELSYAQRVQTGVLGGSSQSQANWCVANDVCCGNKTWAASAKANCTGGCCGSSDAGAVCGVGRLDTTYDNMIQSAAYAIGPLRRDVFGTEASNYAIPWQPDNNLISGEWNSQPAVVVFSSPQNIAYLKQEVLRQHNGALADIELLNYMRQYGVGYYESICDFDYPATTPDEVGPLVVEMNRRTVQGIGRDYYASRQWVGLWRQLQHTGTQVGFVAPVRDYNGFDSTIETDQSQGWQQYNYRSRGSMAAQGYDVGDSS